MRISLLLITAALAACTVESPVPLPPGADGGPADAAGLDAGAGTDVVAASDTPSAQSDVPTTTEGAVPRPDAPCVDNDNDGYPASECGGMAPDCDDNNPMRNPGRTEVCDSMGVDEDCNPCTVAGATDGDGDRDTFLGAGCFNRYTGTAPMSCGPAVRIDGAMLRTVGRDCDDTNNNVRPDQTESCNNRDDNCNGMVDEGVTNANWYLDRDGDGHAGRTETGVMACAAPSPRHVRVNDDCDDTDPLVAPSAPEVCDGAMRDENCNGMANEGGCECAPIGVSRACCGSRGTQTCTAAPMGATWSACSATSTDEVCDGVDNDCDGAVDEGTQVSCYRDADGDGFAAVSATAESRCPPMGRPEQCPSGYTATAPVAASGTTATTIDCDDTPGSGTARFPNARETCNGLDDDCDGATDEAITQACYTGPASTQGRGVCRGGTQTCSMGVFGACAGQVIPTAEVCDGQDNDCDNAVDEQATTVTCGLGACARSTSNCVGGRPISCTAGSPSGEICDNVDNDCNGVVDGITRGCGNNNDYCSGTDTCSAGRWSCNAPRRCPILYYRDGNGNCSFDHRDPGVSRTWRQGTAANYSEIPSAGFGVPAPLLGLEVQSSCYTVDVNVRFSQSSYCPGTGGTAEEVNNTIGCDNGDLPRSIPSRLFANGGDMWLSGCRPGGRVQVNKTINGEFFPGPCNRTVSVIYFSYRIHPMCQCRWRY